MSDLADLLKQLSTDIAEALEYAVREVTELRREVVIGELSDTPVEIHERLLKTRKAMDRAETFVAHLGRLYSRAQVAEADVKGLLDDAEARAIEEAGPAEEYSTARERNARLSVRTLDERIALRRVGRQRAEIGEVLTYCQQLLKGMDGTRRDIDTRIRLFSLQVGLER